MAETVPGVGLAGMRASAGEIGVQAKQGQGALAALRRAYVQGGQRRCGARV